MHGHTSRHSMTDSAAATSAQVAIAQRVTSRRPTNGTGHPIRNTANQPRRRRRWPNPCARLVLAGLHAINLQQRELGHLRPVETVMRYRIECRFVDVGVAYIEAASQAEADSKAQELDGGEFLIDERANMGNGEIISIVELDDEEGQS